MIYHNGNHDLDGLDREVRAATKHLRKHQDEFDVIVATGLSGVVPAVTVALRLKKPLAILRKPRDDTHQFGGVYGGFLWVNGATLDGQRAVWIDDFVSMGETRARIREAVRSARGKVVGEYLTRDEEYMSVV